MSELLVRVRGICVGRYRAFVRWLGAFVMRRRGFKVIHFLHIGKTGGTALGRVFHGNQRVGNSWLGLHEHSTTVRRLPKNDQFTFVLRDPVDRFVSAFYSRYRQGKPAYSIPWTEAEASAFASFPDANSLAEALSSPEPECRESARAAMHAIGHVRTRYRDWLGSVENLSELSHRIPLAGWQPELDSYLCCLVDTLGGDPGQYRFPSNAAKSHKGGHGGRAELSDLAIENLLEWYGDDIRWVEAVRRLDLFASNKALVNNDDN